VYEGIFILNSVKIRIGQTAPQIIWKSELNNAWGISIAAVLLISIYWMVRSSLKRKSTKASPKLELLGRSTYFFYLVHLTVAGSFANLVVRVFSLSDQSYIPFLSLFLFAVGTSIFFAKCVEKPLSAKIKSLLSFNN